jgi:hypothetical protein
LIRALAVIINPANHGQPGTWRRSEEEVSTMEICEYCGEEIVVAPYHHRGHTYCSKSCAEEHAMELSSGGDDDDENGDEPVDEADEELI